MRQQMQEKLCQTGNARFYQTANAGLFLSEGGCSSLSIKQRMQESLYETSDAEETLSDRRRKILSDSRCRTHSLGQRMQETLYQNIECRNLSIRQRMQLLSIRQRMQDCLYQTEAGCWKFYQTAFTVSLSDSGCRRQSFRQQMKDSLYRTADAGPYQTGDARVTI